MRFRTFYSSLAIAAHDMRYATGAFSIGFVLCELVHALMR